MAYKTGDKFIIEIDSVMTNKHGTLYGIKGFKTLMFDDYGLEQLRQISPFAMPMLMVGDEVKPKDKDIGNLGTAIVLRIEGAVALVLTPNYRFPQQVRVKDLVLTGKNYGDFARFYMDHCYCDAR